MYIVYFYKTFTSAVSRSTYPDINLLEHSTYIMLVSRGFDNFKFPDIGKKHGQHNENIVLKCNCPWGHGSLKVCNFEFIENSINIIVDYLLALPEESRDKFNRAFPLQLNSVYTIRASPSIRIEVGIPDENTNYGLSDEIDYLQNKFISSAGKNRKYLINY